MESQRGDRRRAADGTSRPALEHHGRRRGETDGTGDIDAHGHTPRNRQHVTAEQISYNRTTNPGQRPLPSEPNTARPDNRGQQESYYRAPPQDQSYTIARGNDSSRAYSRYHPEYRQREVREAGAQVNVQSYAAPIRSRSYSFGMNPQQHPDPVSESRRSTHRQPRQQYTRHTSASDEHSDDDNQRRVEEQNNVPRQPRGVQSATDSGARAFGLTGDVLGSVGIPLGLKGDILGFVEIPLANFDLCKKFIDNHKDVLKTDLEKLRTAASQAKQHGNIALTKRCVQRFVLIEACRDDCGYKNREERDRYFENLIRNDSNELEKFRYNCDFLERRLDAEARPSREPSRAQAGHASPATRSYSGTMPPTSFPTSASARPSLERTDSRRSAPAFKPLQDILDGPGPGTVARTTKTSYPMPTENSSIVERRRMSLQTFQTQYPPTANQGRNAEFRPDNTGPRERGAKTLDPRYRVRVGPECAAFFVPGRVISIIQHSSMGAESKATNPRTLLDRYGEPIYSGPRRMIIALRRQGYSVCVPISTHGQKGIGSKNLNHQEQQAHAIVYDEGSGIPDPLAGEPRFSKQPIAVRLRHDQTLDPSSRIHFGKYHTVEHNVKVMEVGRVTEESMPAFEAYCRQELLRG